MKKTAILLLMFSASLAFSQTINTGTRRKVFSGSPPPSTTYQCFNLGLNSPQTSPSIDTTGATAIAFTLTWYRGSSVAAIDITDNKGNGTATKLTVYSSASVSDEIQYYLAPTVGTGHTFTFTGVGGSTYAASACVVAMSGITAYDSGTDSGNSTSGTTCQVTPAINPGAGTHLLIASSSNAIGDPPTIDSSFVVQANAVLVGGTAYGTVVASLSQSPGASVQPTWTQTTGGEIACTIASFH